MTRVLIIDDENDICFLVSEILSDESFSCQTANNSNEAISKFNKFQPELIILDVWLGNSELDGLELLLKFKELNPLLPVIIISGHGNVDMAVNAIKNGAYDFLEKPFNSDKLIITSNRAIESAKLIKENNKLMSIASPSIPLIGKSNFINNLNKNLKKISESNSRVLISGPRGVGKKLLSHAIHQHSVYSKIFCNIIDIKNSLDDELDNFFTESENNINKNIFVQSNNNTLIIENIDSLNINYQKKFLFLLENKDFFNKNNIDINQKIISISSKNILNEISKGNFLQSLYERLSVINIQVPPINQRRNDIMPISEFYLNFHKKDKNRNLSFSPQAQSKLELYEWPGNISQIINYVERTIILNHNLNINTSFEIENIPLDMGSFKKDNDNTDKYELSLKEARYKFEKDYLLSQIKRFNGNMKNISEFTGMERTALYRKLKSLNIDI